MRHFHDRKSILMIQPYLEPGGAHIMNFRLAEHLSRSGWNIEIAVMFSKKNENKKCVHIPESVDFIHLNAQRINDKAILPRRISRIAKNHDILLSGMEVAATNYGYIASKFSSKPFIAWVHTNFLEHGKVLSHLDRFISHAIYRKIKYVVFPSKGARDSLALSLGKKPVGSTWQVIENFNSPADKNSGFLISQRELPGYMFTKPVILSVGRLAPVKAFDRIVRIHARLISQGVENHLVILGNGTERKKLESEINRLGVSTSAFLPGHVQDVKPWLKQAMVLALSSIYEGFPLAVLEAMQAGLPVVSMDCPSGPRELLDDGRAGILIPNGDEEAFQAALSKILTEPELRKHYSEQGRIRAALFTPERIVPRWESLFERVISTHARENRH